MFIFLIPYRSRGGQKFRRNEIINLLDNLQTYLNVNNVLDFKIIVSEQNNDDLFNRGILYNTSFIEAVKIFTPNNIFIMLNCDYTFNLNIPFCKEFLLSKRGFIDIYSVSEDIPLLGGCCSFDAVSYIHCNGFPNDIYGWGGEDLAILRRIRENNIPYDVSIRNTGIIKDNSGWVIKNKNTTVINNEEHNLKNVYKALNDSIGNNGLNTCQYIIDNVGEFHNLDKNVYHFLFSF